MKVAIQLFGHLRTYDKCYQRLFLCLADNYDCDIFIHTWNTIDHNTKTWHNYKMNKNISSDEIHNIIKTCYCPKSYKVEIQKYKDEGCIVANNKTISVFGMHMMIHSMKECNKLRQEYEKKNNIKYDYIVVLRPDVELWTPLFLENFIESTDKKYLNKSFYFGGFYKYRTILNDWRSIGGSDVLFFAPNNVMNEIFSNAEKILSDIKNQQLSVYGPEYSFLHAIDNLGINLQMIDYLWGKDFTVIRDENISQENKKTKKTYWYKKIIRYRISNKMFKLRLLTVFTRNIFEIDFNIFNRYFISISLGKPSNWEE